jgi:exopolyphosphatase/guanosine-5'-triphosphate,3'-diphosphate pyrophosphatase
LELLNQPLKLAAIDIGSNAIRFQITSVHRYQQSYTFKKVEYIRFPIRLGEEVFIKGTISTWKMEKMVKLFKAFSLLIDLYEIDHYLVYATSALREASNGQEVIKLVEEHTGIKIKLIDGLKEAEIINRVVQEHMGVGSYLHIDVGGGSTEITTFLNGVKQKSISFTLGSVRRLDGQDSPEVWKEMEKWIQKNTSDFSKQRMAVGTGGNINKIAELAGHRGNKALDIKKIQAVVNKLKKMTIEQRVNEFMLNPDRADVIVPAADIYISVMKWAGIEQIEVPVLGLKDGMIRMLFEKHAGEVKNFTADR